MVVVAYKVLKAKTMPPKINNLFVILQLLSDPLLLV